MEDATGSTGRTESPSERPDDVTSADDLLDAARRVGHGPLGDLMVSLPPHPDLNQLRRQAKELLTAARAGDADATARLRTVSGPPRLSLATAQLALAREYGFPSWPRLTAEVGRRAVLDSADVGALSRMVREDRRRATEVMQQWCDHPLGATPLSYVAMMRFDTARAVWRDVPGTGDLARTLLAAGAPVDGEPGCPETPLMTAASYGDPAVTQVLLDAGADVHATAADTAGGVPGGTALDHAAVFGMTRVVDLLTAAGARPSRISIAAATGDVSGWLDAGTPVDDRVRALIMAARHGRLTVIDDLIRRGTPVDAVDPLWGGQPLRSAVARPTSIARLLDHGADPNLCDDDTRTALDLCRAGRREHPDEDADYAETEALLTPVTVGGRPDDGSESHRS